MIDQDDWKHHFTECNGNHESPINIDSTQVVIDSNLKIQFFNYDEEFYKTTAQNNGHTGNTRVNIYMKAYINGSTVRVFLLPNHLNENPYITGEAINNEIFILDSFHFHWGLNEFNGSEHSINNIKRSAEVFHTLFHSFITKVFICFGFLATFTSLESNLCKY